MKWFSLLALIFVTVPALLFASQVTYADDPPDEDSDTVVDIEIDGDLKVDIGVSGPTELNVGVEGPSQVHIDAGDEVELNIEASDEAQVSTGNGSCNEPAKNQDIEDKTGGYFEAQPSKIGEPISQSDNRQRVMSIAFPLAALLASLPIGWYLRNKRVAKRQ